MSTQGALKLGRVNRLQVVRPSKHGLFLDGYEAGDILLPGRYVQGEMRSGDWLEVFVYADSEDRLVATTERPKAQVGEVACLEVVAVNPTGAFLDWGLPKDLFVPYSEQPGRMHQGKRYCVFIYVDKHHDRILASTRLSKFLPEQAQGQHPGQGVTLTVCSRSDLGYKCLIDGAVLGLLHHGDVFQPLKPGQELEGFIKQVRPDGRIDLSLTAPGKNVPEDLEGRILAYLEQADGQTAPGDKAPPEDIYHLFQVSKKNYKRALSALYKRRLITIDEQGVRRA